MTEKTKTNEENIDNKNVNEEGEKNQPTIEELMLKIKEMESNNQKGVQKLINEKKETEKQMSLYQSTVKESKKVASDPKYLLELKLKNPDVAENILKEYYDGMDIETYKKENEITDEYIDVDFLAEKKANEIANKKIVSMIKKSYEKTLGLDEQNLEKFENIFNDLVDGKKLNEENVEKYLKYAKDITGIGNNENNKNNQKNNNEEGKKELSQEEIDNIVAKQLGLGGGGNSNDKSKGKDKEQEEIDNFINSII